MSEALIIANATKLSIERSRTMANGARVAKELGRKFYEEVVKPAMNERYVVEKYTGKDFELYAILDTKTQLTYRTVFSFKEHAQQVCDRLNAKRRKEQK